MPAAERERVEEKGDILTPSRGTGEASGKKPGKPRASAARSLGVPDGCLGVEVHEVDVRWSNAHLPQH